MAESYLKFRGGTLERVASQFALWFAMIAYCVERKKAELATSPDLIELAQVVRAKNLDHDHYHVFDLGSHLTSEGSVAGLLGLISDSILLVRKACLETGVPTSFYTTFGDARFAPPFPDEAAWQVVAWPFIQVASMLLVHSAVGDARPLLKTLGWQD